MGSLLSLLRMHWGHEPRQLVGRGVLTAPRPGGLGTARPTLRFMESEHLQNSDVSWGHEPGLRKSLDCRQTTFRFMESSVLRRRPRDGLLRQLLRERPAETDERLLGQTQSPS